MERINEEIEKGLSTIENNEKGLSSIEHNDKGLNTIENNEHIDNKSSIDSNTHNTIEQQNEM